MPGRTVCPPIVGLGVAGAVLVGLAFAAPALAPGADPADLVTRQTARVAVLFWGLAAAGLLLGHPGFARAAWTVGCGTFLVHVATAFDRVHGWSHAAAFEHVEVVSGFGPGVFVSYAFTLAWVADAAWWWLDRPGYEGRPRWAGALVHGFLAFVVFNGTVVYEAGFIRWAGLGLFAALGVAAGAKRLGVVAARS